MTDIIYKIPVHYILLDRPHPSQYQELRNILLDCAYQPSSNLLIPSKPCKKPTRATFSHRKRTQHPHLKPLFISVEDTIPMILSKALGRVFSGYA